jgi:hypothetical protein
MSERRELPEMIGEAMREGGVLVAVFGMLDKFVHGEGPSSAWTSAVLAISLFLFAVGATIERRRR